MTHLGIDAGGTSTRAVVVDPAGHCLGHGRSGSGNPISSGPHVAAASLREAAEQALAAAGLPGSAVGSTSVAMAGGSRIAEDDEVAATIGGALLAAGVHASLAVEPDLLALYFSGTHEPSGYALVAGTGAAAVRVVEGEVVATCDGLGWLLGDGGAGFWIGREVVRAVCADLDGRGPSTALTPLLLEAAPNTDPDTSEPVAPGGGRAPALRHLVRQLYAVPPVHLARFAPLAFAAADSADDEVAADIIARAGASLTRTLAAVLLPDLDGPVVLGGGVLVSQGLVGDVVRASLVATRRRAPVVAVTDGLVGAAVLALRRSGVTVDAATFATVTDSLARLR
jgi:glucosamine kinase